MMMKKQIHVSHGGARTGAGRPPGSRNRLTIDREQLANEAVARLHAAGISNDELTPSKIASMSPLDVMSYCMTSLAMAGNWREAAMIAKDIAPFRHAKMQHVTTVATIRRIEDLNDDELLALVGGDDGDEAEEEEEA